MIKTLKFCCPRCKRLHWLTVETTDRQMNEIAKQTICEKCANGVTATKRKARESSEEEEEIE